VIGGLVSAALLTLFVLPALCARFARPPSLPEVRGTTGLAAAHEE